MLNTFYTSPDFFGSSQQSAHSRPARGRRYTRTPEVSGWSERNAKFFYRPERRGLVLFNFSCPPSFSLGEIFLRHYQSAGSVLKHLLHVPRLFWFKPTKRKLDPAAGSVLNNLLTLARVFWFEPTKRGHETGAGSSVKTFHTLSRLFRFKAQSANSSPRRYTRSSSFLVGAKCKVLPTRSAAASYFSTFLAHRAFPLARFFFVTTELGEHCSLIYSTVLPKLVHT